MRAALSRFFLLPPEKLDGPPVFLPIVIARYLKGNGSRELREVPEQESSEEKRPGDKSVGTQLIESDARSRITCSFLARPSESAPSFLPRLRCFAAAAKHDGAALWR